MFGLADTGVGLDFLNMYYYQLVADRYPNLVFKFAYLKYLDDMVTFNISEVDRGK